MLIQSAQVFCELGWQEFKGLRKLGDFWIRGEYVTAAFGAFERMAQTAAGS